MTARDDEERGRTALRPWAFGLALGLVGLAVLLTLLLAGNNWPRKRVARRIMAARDQVVALLPASMTSGDRIRFQEAINCTARVVWADRLPGEEAVPLVATMLGAARDGTLSAGEVAAIQAQATWLCERGGGSPGRLTPSPGSTPGAP